MFKRLLAIMVMVFVLAGTCLADESVTSSQMGNSRLRLEYMGTGVVGSNAGVSGSGLGVAVTYLPFRVEFDYYRVEDKEGDERKELDINTAYLGYRWSPYKVKKPTERAYFSGVYIDTGVNIGSKQGTTAKVINPAKSWSDPHLGEGDIVRKDVNETFVAGVIGPVFEWTAEQVIVMTFFVRAHIQEEDPFVSGGASFGLRF